MKRLFTTVLTVSATLFAVAQDVIFLGSNDSIVAKVISVGTSEITYQKWTNLQGPTYSMSINDVAAIRYANGTYDFFSNKSNVSKEKSNQNSSIMLTRSGNTYYYGNRVMNKDSMLEWLETQNCSAAYTQFRKGLKIANVGWCLMVTGIAADIIGAVLIGTSKGERSIPGITLSCVGGALEIACIPTIAVGYSKMHQIVNVYNISCGTTAQVRPYWSLQASNNGIGLAYNF